MKPSKAYMACDGSAYLGSMQWTVWAADQADGSGQFAQNNCTPNCAAGAFTDYPVAVHLDKTVTTSCGIFYTHFTTTFSGASPPGWPHDGTVYPVSDDCGAANAPTLGVASAMPGGEGFGAVKPATIYLGHVGSAASVENIDWQRWGGQTARGTGTGYYFASGAMDADTKSEPATVVAFNLGMCEGHSTYLSVEWYFPQEGQTFDPKNGIDICGASSPGTSVASAGPPASQDGQPETPMRTWAAILGSLTSQNQAQRQLDSVRNVAPNAAILHSDDVPSLNSGYWVVYVGGFPTSDAAITACRNMGRGNSQECYAAYLSPDAADSQRVYP